ncbi:MAG: hypothetical protein HW375_2309 [Anaerolineales bacterium]|nr:hypothetical protein [Anaerolineales bacterium]
MSRQLRPSPPVPALRRDAWYGPPAHCARPTLLAPERAVKGPCVTERMGHSWPSLSGRLPNCPNDLEAEQPASLSTPLPGGERSRPAPNRPRNRRVSGGLTRSLQLRGRIPPGSPTRVAGVESPAGVRREVDLSQACSAGAGEPKGSGGAFRSRRRLLLVALTLSILMVACGPSSSGLTSAPATDASANLPTSSPAPSTKAPPSATVTIAPSETPVPVGKLLDPCTLLPAAEVMAASGSEIRGDHRRGRRSHPC